MGALEDMLDEGMANQKYCNKCKYRVEFCQCKKTIYMASSWKNPLYETTVALLKEAGHTILDWRENGFGWNQATPIPKDQWTGRYYRDVVLKTKRARDGFQNDFSLMTRANCCVLLLPCGRSAHLEAGWFVGKFQPLHIYIPVYEEPELMYLFANSISFSIEELLTNIEK